MTVACPDCLSNLPSLLLGILFPFCIAEFISQRKAM